MTLDHDSDARPDAAAEAETETVVVISRRPRWLNRRLAGQVMIGVAAVGFVTALVGAVVAWQLVGELALGTDRSLAVAEDALVTVDGTIDVADAVVASVDAGLGTVQSTLRTMSRAIDDTAAIAATTADIAVDVPGSIDRVDDALATIEDLSGTIDTMLREVSRLPLVPNYDPAVPLAEAIADVRDDLAPIAENLRSAAGELEGFSDSSDELTSDLAALVQNVGAVRTALGGSAELLEEYRSAAADARDLASRTRSDLDADLLRTRVLIVILGVTVAVGQIVPFWVGRELLLEPAPSSSSAGTIQEEVTR